MRIRNIERISIHSFGLDKACGRPGVCRVAVHIPENESVTDWLAREGQIMAVTTDEDEPLFFGPVCRVSVETTISGSMALMKAVSSAYREDIEVHRRFFQKPGKTFGDILDADRLKVGELSLDSALKGKPYEPLLLQNESNFTFMKRLAAEAGRKMWVLDTSEGNPRLAVAFCLDKAAFCFDAEKIFVMRQTRDAHGQRLRVASSEYCALGRIAKVPGLEGKFLVIRLRLTLENGRDVFCYDLEEYRENDKNPVGRGPAVILTGTIADASDPDNLGRVTFAVDAEEAEDEDSEKTWLPLLSPYTGIAAGMVFIPEKDDPALLVLCDGKAYVQAALRRTELPDEAKNVADKYLGNNYGQRLIWKDGILEMHSGDSSLIMKTDEILLTCADNTLLLNKDGIKANASGEASVTAKNGDVFIKGKTIKLA